MNKKCVTITLWRRCIHVIDSHTNWGRDNSQKEKILNRKNATGGLFLSFFVFFFLLRKRFTSLYKLVLINYWLLLKLSRFSLQQYFLRHIKIRKQYAFLKFSFSVIFFPTFKTQTGFEYQLAIYGSHKIQIFINITSSQASRQTNMQQ